MSTPTKLSFDRHIDLPDLSPEEINKITRIVFYAPPPMKSDVLMIFGAPEGDWTPAAKAYKDGLINLIIPTGGLHERTNGQTEAHLIKLDLIKNGVPEDIIIEEGTSTNTLENVLYFKKILDERGIKPNSILYLAIRYCAGRDYLTLKKYFPECTITALTHGLIYSGMDITADNWSQDPRKAGRVYGEYQRILTYAAQDHIADPSILLT